MRPPSSALDAATVALLVLGAGLLSACPVERADPPVDNSRQRCTPGIRYCDGQVAELCGDDGYVAERIACDETQTCFGGFCDDNRICQADTFYCVQNVLKQCNAQGTALVGDQDCGDMVCANGACVPVSQTCPPSTAFCDGNSAAVCDTSGSGYVSGPTDCGAAICIDGACLDVVCDAGRSTCQDNLALTCDAWGTGYSYQETCEGGLVCVAGRCQILQCTPGTHCQGDLVVVCSEDGTAVIETRSCEADETCIEDRCVARQVDAGVPDAARQDSSQADTWRSDTTRPDTAQPDTLRPDAAQPDSARPDSSRPDTLQAPNCAPIDDAYEPNDSRGAARSIANDGTVADLVACDEEDWFSASLPDDRSVEIALTFLHAEVDLDLYVFEPGSDVEWGSSKSTTDNESLAYTGTSDTIYIAVDNYDWPDKQAGYSLTLTLGEPPVCGDGVVNGDEDCDTAIESGYSGACPTSCTDSYCSRYNLVDNGPCYRYCASTPITSCVNGDECCPQICTAYTDDYCPSGWVPCSGDHECPADRYCDLSRAAPVCKEGCRTNDASTCGPDHRCASDHRCVLAYVVPHQRCAACDDNNPCDQGFSCTMLINVCAPACNILLDDCEVLVGPGEMCLLTACSMGDCP